MKKIVLALMVATAMFVACQKNDVVKKTKSDTPIQKQLLGFTYGVSTAGEVHHLLFDEYFKRFSTDTLGIDTITVPIMDSFYRRVAKIAVDSGIIQNLDPDTFMLKCITSEINQGLFNNGIRKMNDVITTQIAAINNSSIRSVFTNINNYNSAPSGYLSYVDAQIATLSNLSTWDQLLVDMYQSIQHDSYITMGAKYTYTNYQKAKIIANADAVAAGRALKDCLSDGTWLLGSVYVEYYCAGKAASASAAMYAYLKAY